MAQGKSANHDGSAFPGTQPASSQNTVARPCYPLGASHAGPARRGPVAVSEKLRCLDLLHRSDVLLESVPVAWALFLLLCTLLNASLLVDETAFVRVGARFDHPAVAWLGAVFGTLCIVVVSIHLRNHSAERSVRPSDRSAEAMQRLLSVFALLGFSYHEFALRWPWLTGESESTMRLTVWSATLSTTWYGVPWLAFGELLSLSLVLAHAAAGLFATARWRSLAASSRGVHLFGFIATLVVCLLGCAVVVALATGSR
jgi:hypothetical protein